MATTQAPVGAVLERVAAAYPHARYELDWATPFQLLVATILAAQTPDKQVNRITPALFAQWPDAQALASADLDEIEAVVRPLGMGKVKAKALQSAARALVDRFGGQVPPRMEDLVTLPGVGRKSANVVLNTAFNQASGIIVDTHVARVSRRLGLSASESPEEIERDLMQQVPQARWTSCGPAMVLLGRYVCKAKVPLCGECPLAEICPSRREPSTDETDKTDATYEADRSDDWRSLEPLRAITRPAVVASPVVEAAPETLTPSWQAVLGDELDKPYFRELAAFLEAERAGGQVFPPAGEVFTAFRLTPFEKVKVLLLGQDPYHDHGQAHGLCFSVRPGVKPPPSLANIYKELHADLGVPIPATGFLECWARQGILMLNAVLTVRAHQPNSHKDRGWEQFTDEVIRRVSERGDRVVFVLWGAYARKKARLVDAARHCVIEGAHPSPLSAKLWFGSRPFSQVNQALKSAGKGEIDWAVRE